MGDLIVVFKSLKVRKKESGLGSFIMIARTPAWRGLASVEFDLNSYIKVELKH